MTRESTSNFVSGMNAQAGTGHREPSREGAYRNHSPAASTDGSATPAHFELRIEELLLTGFPRGDRFPIADAIERELVRLLSENGIPGLQELPLQLEGLDAGKFKAAPGARASVIGKQAAQAIYRQMSSPHHDF